MARPAQPRAQYRGWQGLRIPSRPATQAGCHGNGNTSSQNWSDTGPASHNVTAQATSATYTAGFTTQYNLTTSAGSGGSILPVTGWYNSGAVVPVSASATGGYQFTGFSGGLTGSSTPQNVTMSGPVTVRRKLHCDTDGDLVTGRPCPDGGWRRLHDTMHVYVDQRYQSHDSGSRNHRGSDRCPKCVNSWSPGGVALSHRSPLRRLRRPTRRATRRNTT